MSSKLFFSDHFKKNNTKGKISLTVDTIKAALTAEFSTNYGTWAASTSYSEGDIKIPTSRNGHRYRVKTGGTSGSSEPSWPTSEGATVADNEVEWEEYGGEHGDLEQWAGTPAANEVSDGNGYSSGGQSFSNQALNLVSGDPKLLRYDADDVTWTSLSKTMRHAFLYRRSPRTSLNDGSSDYWSSSSSGTNEFYYNQGDVSNKPLAVYAGGMMLTEGTAGSLSPGQWAWGNNDSLGSNTIYVRLSDEVDPDSKTADYLLIVASDEGVADPLVAYVLLDDTPADVSVSGVDFSLNFASEGVLEIVD